MSMNRLPLVLLVLLALLVVGSTAYACVGARSLAMGGAFVGLADDVQATYWNPAGLVQMKESEATWMHTATNRDEVNYQDYMAVAIPYSDKLAIGGSWINQQSVYIDGVEDGEAIFGLDDMDTYWLSLGYKVNENTSVGINLKSLNNSAAGVDTDMGIDLGILSKRDKQLQYGMLIQNANEPKTTKGPHGITWVRNFRPGLAYRPDAQSVVALEIYDLTDDAGARSLRVGYEKQLANSLAVRAGIYSLGLDGGTAFTFGAGKSVSSGNAGALTFDAAVMLGDIEAVLLSSTMKF